jgi:hypothetical protein
MKKLIASLLVSTVVVSGCATTGGSLSRPAMGGLECGAAAALATGLVCALLGGGSATCGGASGGALVLAGAACYGLASHYEQRRKELAGKEQDVDALLTFAKANNADAEKANQDLNAKLAEVSARTDEITLKVEQGAITGRKIAKEREALQKEEQAAKEQVEVQKVALQDMRSLRAQLPQKAAEDNVRLAELDTEISKYERLLAETQRATTAYAAQAGRF